MSTLFETEVYSERQRLPWAAIRLADMMRDLAGNAGNEGSRKHDDWLAQNSRQRPRQPVKPVEREACRRDVQQDDCDKGDGEGEFHG